jgi:microsomal dipeptidase-like Zn-dependent dipeptidase
MHESHGAFRLRLVTFAALAAVCALGLGAGASGSPGNLSPSASPVSGYADLHAHQFSNLAFGGLLVWGEPFHANGISWALPWSDFMPAAAGEVVDLAGNPVGRFACGVLGYPQCPPQCPPGTGIGQPNPCEGVAIHGAGGLNDLLNLFLSGNIGHPVGGFPQFDGWPRWNNYTGQQMYVDWLERSWRGGQRLMVMLAVNNETLCRLVNRRATFGCDDMPAVDRQIQAAKNLEAYVDAQNGGPGTGWYRIAYSSAQARQIIASGKLAVVLGVEVPSLFGCKKNSGCTEQYVRGELDRYYSLGVRHVFPVHNADNAFGGTGLYNDLFAFNNKAITGDWWDVVNCDPASGIDFHVGSMTNPLIQAVAALIGQPMPATPQGSSCNNLGLTALGESFLNMLMDKRMVIDLDHLSTKALDRALTLAEARDYPALAMSHTGFRAMAQPGGEANHEANKNAQQLARIRDLGGIVATILHQGTRNDVKTYSRPDGSVPVQFDCGGSSQAFAQMYLYAAEQMQGRAVALGSDFNGLAGMPAPRFGAERCHGDHPSSYNPIGGVQYPFTAPSGVQLDKQVVGNKTFDYNVDGLGNAGLVPDFLEDLRSQGADLQPLMRSAEQYVRMWELAEDTTPPTVQCATPDGAWHPGNVSLACTASDAVAGLANPADASFALATSVAAGAETADAQTGQRTVCDLRNNCTTVGPIGGNKVDRKAPGISLVSPAARTYTVGESLSSAYTCNDGGSGVSTCLGTLANGAAIDTTLVGPRTFSVSAVDQVGNSSSASVDYVVAYGICPLYDTTKAKPAGSTVPLRFQLCTNSGANLSSPSILVSAVDVTLASIEAPGPVEPAGNANPDSNFRYDASLGGTGGYVFNLGSAGLGTGTWRLRFRASGDPTLHTLEFQLK